MIRVLFFVFISGTVLARSFEPYHVPFGSSVWGYFTPPMLKRPQQLQTPMEAMVDLTNSLGVAILQDHSYSRGNFAFSPYGVASVLVVMYEGARGESANQIHRAVGFPSNKDVLRTGFRNIHRHLRSYFSHEGFLSGISLNKNGSNLKPEYKKILKYYGYDVDLNVQLHDESKVDQDAKHSTRGTEPTKAAVTTTPQPNNEKPSTTGINEMNLKNKTDSEAKNPEESTEKEGAEVGSELPATTLVTMKKDTLPITENEFTESGNQVSTTTLVTNIRETFPTTEKETKEGGSEIPTTTLVTTVRETLPTTEKETKEGGNEIRTTTLVTTRKETPNTEKITTGDDESELVSTIGLKEEALTPRESISTTQAMMTTEPMGETNTEDPTTTETNEADKRTKAPENEEMKQSTAIFPEDVMRLPEILEPDYNKENKFQKNLDFDEKEVKCKKVAGTDEKMTEILCKEEKQERTSDKLTEKAPEGQTESDGIKLDNGMLIPQQSEEPTKLGLENIVSESSFLQFTTEAVDSTKRPEKFSLEEAPNQKFSRAIDKIGLRRVLKPNNEGWEKQLRKLFDSKTSFWEYEPRKKRKGARAERHRRTIADYLKWPLNPDLSLQLQNGMYDTHVSRNAEMYRSLPRLMFLVDGAIDTPVPMMTYTNVFPYGYIPKLHAKALEFPLDDIRYKLLIVLPMERRGLRQLIYDLADFSVRDVLKCLRPTRVKAVIPTFMVEGFVILTSSLQKLGIWDVFDPRKANLSGMSVDPELYVRNIEQSVTVVIRNYVEILDIQTRTMAARYLEYEFEATHPFVYFVLDTATNIALMAGQMLDPLNSRIY